MLDGLGGHPAGDIAATLAAEVIASGKFPEVKTEQDVISLREEEPTGFCMTRCSSTKACGTWAPLYAGVLVTTDTVVRVFHVGDSRVYVHTGEQLAQVTVDDWGGWAISPKRWEAIPGFIPSWFTCIHGCP